MNNKQNVINSLRVYLQLNRYQTQDVTQFPDDIFSSKRFQHQTERLGKHDRSTEQVITAEEKALVCHYNGRQSGFIDVQTVL